MVGHTIEFREAAKSQLGDEALIKGAKALANTGYRILTDAELLHNVRKEYEEALAKKQDWAEYLIRWMKAYG